MALKDEAKKLNEKESEKVNGGHISRTDISKYLNQTLLFKDHSTVIGHVVVTNVLQIKKTIFEYDEYRVSVVPADFETCRNLYDLRNRHPQDIALDWSTKEYADETLFNSPDRGRNYTFIIQYGFDYYTYLDE